MQTAAHHILGGSLYGVVAVTALERAGQRTHRIVVGNGGDSGDVRAGDIAGDTARVAAQAVHLACVV